MKRSHGGGALIFPVELEFIDAQFLDAKFQRGVGQSEAFGGAIWTRNPAVAGA